MWLTILDWCDPPPSSAHYSCALAVLLSVSENVKNVWHIYTCQHMAIPSKKTSTVQHTRKHCTSLKKPDTTQNCLMYAGQYRGWIFHRRNFRRRKFRRRNFRRRYFRRRNICRRIFCRIEFSPYRLFAELNFCRSEFTPKCFIWKVS